MPIWLTPTAKETNRDTHQERSAGVLRSNKLNRKGIGGGASGCRAAIMMPPKLQLLAVVAFAVAMLFLENQIQKLEESRSKLEARSVFEAASKNLHVERAIARHEVREIEQRHTMDGPRQDVALDEEDDMVIIYNRVPKTASTSFTNIAYDLCAKNKYHVLHINTTKNNPVMSLQDQVRFVKNITSWKEMKPGFYHGHISYLDFAKFGVKKKPIYINVIRDPIERLVSYYYFLRFGDDYRPGLRRRKQGDKKTFDECVAEGGSDCAPEKLWLQIPFFCGHSSECWNVGSRWAMDQAKYNLINEYFLVGVTEELEDFIMLLEAALPRFFRGATELYRTGKKSHLRKTTEKKLPTKQTIAKLQQSDIWKMENEFYEFALEQFQFIRAHAVREKDGDLYILAQNFFYEKIYPKSN
ncbi:heparan sulfate 2-O-sulfotransferase 1 isoform X2 [Bubalus kerabau]|uniref:heparan sulfate 2-O-sulfotransferase 1 isoform X2 n=2 Tax=Pecora TaxID=35500 RepID=UPI00244E5E6E|nr:heparan sulfate 2-O-sulfotransferase 1 isoform X2 [Bubalus carabanensis]